MGHGVHAVRRIPELAGGGRFQVLVEAPEVGLGCRVEDFHRDFRDKPVLQQMGYQVFVVAQMLPQSKPKRFTKTKSEKCHNKVQKIAVFPNSLGVTAQDHGVPAAPGHGFAREPTIAVQLLLTDLVVFAGATVFLPALVRQV